jgi:L-threonylcarbamoyladenylate synthase
VFLPGNGKTERIISRYDELASQGKKVIILALDDNAPKYGDRMVFSMGVDDKSYAKRLFSALRDADKKGYDAVLCEGLPERGYGLSVMNRLLKAAAGKVE